MFKGLHFRVCDATPPCAYLMHIFTNSRIVEVFSFEVSWVNIIDEPEQKPSLHGIFFTHSPLPEVMAYARTFVSFKTLQF